MKKIIYIFAISLFALPVFAQEDIIQRPGGGRSGNQPTLPINNAPRELNLNLHIPQLEKLLNTQQENGNTQQLPVSSMSSRFIDSIIIDLVDLQNISKRLKASCKCELEWKKSIERFSATRKAFLEALKQTNTKMISVKAINELLGDLSIFENNCNCDIARELLIKDIKFNSELLLKKVEALK